MRREDWDPWRLGLGAFALLLFVNAIWMLVDPSRWYADLPAGVPDFGAYNEHFVRDVGCAFLTVAAALAWAAWRPALRFPLVSIAAVFLVAHAALHVYDTARGYVHDDHWWLDLPGVYLPALVATGIALRFRREPAPPSGTPR